MRNELVSVVYKWLHQLRIPVSPGLLKKNILSHPDFPSMVSITDALDEMGIPNGAYVIDRDEWNDLPFPFLAHVNVGGGEFIIVQKKDEGELAPGGKLEHWNGIAAFAEKPDGWKNAANEQELKKEKFRSRVWIWSLAAIGVLAFSSIEYSLQGMGLLIATIAGLAVAVMIVQNELGISNEIAEKLCGMGSKSDCNGVITSKGSHIGTYFSWSDAGIIYFTSFLLVWLSSPVLLPFISAAAIPFTFFSVYYQGRVVKKWCTLCLVTVAVLWLQFLLQLPALVNFSLLIITLPVIAAALLVFGGMGLIWLGLLKPQLQKRREQEAKIFSLLRFKNNPELFEALLSRQRKVDTVPFENEIQLGDPAAPVQIMVACNPYCGPCARAHENLHHLLSKKIGLRIRFNVNLKIRESRGNLAVAYILQVARGKTNEYKSQVLRDWFLLMNIAKFKEKYALAEQSTDNAELILHQKWCNQEKIYRTPTIFINGHELPKGYNTSDLLIVL